MSVLHRRLLWLAAFLAVPARAAWAQHAGHGGYGGFDTMSMSGSQQDDDRERRRSLLEQLERLGDKIEKIDAELAKPDITAKRREKLERKLKKLLAQRDRLLPSSPEVPVRAPPASGVSTAEAVYSCPMGDYSGARTRDGRCPKCGMALLRRGPHEPQGRFEAVRSSGTACSGQTDAGTDACKSP